ncbi:hypothetical protein ACHAPA_011922 [Fusarium lateritium]
MAPLENLQEIANFGPRDFLFSSESSTQFRWSTSAGEFISPHVALPTFPVNMAELETPGGTVPGMPPTTGGQQQATPTARPDSVNHIYNVDPGLARGGCLNGMWQSAPTPEYGADLAIPSDVLDEYIKSNRELPIDRNWPHLQSTNVTSDELLKILHNSLQDVHRRRSSNPDDHTPELADIIPFRTLLVELCDLMDSFLDRLDQVVALLDVAGDVSWKPHVRKAVRLIHDVRPFFKQIAAVRLRHLRDKATHAASVLEDLEAQQNQLRLEIKTAISNRWIGVNSQVLYLASPESLIEE